MSREQHLVNAQVSVNRAVFLMNARNNLDRPEYRTLDASDTAICHDIDEALRSLQDARQGYRSGR